MITKKALRAAGAGADVSIRGYWKLRRKDMPFVTVKVDFALVRDGRTERLYEQRVGQGESPRMVYEGPLARRTFQRMVNLPS